MRYILEKQKETKISERGKYIHIVRVTCDNYFIISTKIWNIAYMTLLSANQIAYIFRANDNLS